MKSTRYGKNHIIKTVMIFATLFTLSYVLTDSASALVIGPLGNPTIIRPPVQTLVRPPIGVPPFGVPSIVRPPIFNPLFMPPVFNPFFRPPIFNPFFRPTIFNPFIGADLDDLGLGVGVGVGVGVGAVD